MSKPQVTITLGRSGQKVVKESFGAGCFNAGLRSGSKRSFAESFGISADHSLIYNGIRMRGDTSERSYGYTIQNDDSCLDPKDLRLKLKRKRISRHIELEIEKRKKVELHEKVSRSIQSLELPERSLLRYIQSSRGAAVPPQMDSIRSSGVSPSTNGARPISQEKVAEYSSGFSALKSTIDELPHVPSRPTDASRTGCVLMSDPLESSRLRVPLPMTSMAPVKSGKLVEERPPVTAGMPRAHYPDNQPLTVSSLLHSLGLGKYVINFQAEEVDMVALKQMGDRDLKELGIPMGPRKKILFALHTLTKRSNTEGILPVFAIGSC